jgi:hypothetical protein
LPQCAPVLLIWGYIEGRMPDLIEHLARQQNPVAIKSIETVSEVSYLGDVGGIICHIQPEDAESSVLVSLTHVRVRRTLPFAAAVLDYQKHRVKKLKSRRECRPHRDVGHSRVNTPVPKLRPY